MDRRQTPGQGIRPFVQDSLGEATPQRVSGRIEFYVLTGRVVLLEKADDLSGMVASPPILVVVRKEPPEPVQIPVPPVLDTPRTAKRDSHFNAVWRGPFPYVVKQPNLILARRYEFGLGDPVPTGSAKIAPQHVDDFELEFRLMAAIPILSIGVGRHRGEITKAGGRRRLISKQHAYLP